MWFVIALVSGLAGASPAPGEGCACSCCAVLAIGVETHLATPPNHARRSGACPLRLQMRLVKSSVDPGATSRPLLLPHSAAAGCCKRGRADARRSDKTSLSSVTASASVGIWTVRVARRRFRLGAHAATWLGAGRALFRTACLLVPPFAVVTLREEGGAAARVSQAPSLVTKKRLGRRPHRRRLTHPPPRPKLASPHSTEEQLATHAMLGRSRAGLADIENMIGKLPLRAAG